MFGNLLCHVEASVRDVPLRAVQEAMETYHTPWHAHATLVPSLTRTVRGRPRSTERKKQREKGCLTVIAVALDVQNETACDHEVLL